jgi:hypothetical protein
VLSSKMVEILKECQNITRSNTSSDDDLDDDYCSVFVNSIQNEGVFFMNGFWPLLVDPDDDSIVVNYNELNKDYSKKMEVLLDFYCAHEFDIKKGSLCHHIEVEEIPVSTKEFFLICTGIQRYHDCHEYKR